jgi:dTDP-4-dehydrorhamnose reductase
VKLTAIVFLLFLLVSARPACVPPCSPGSFTLEFFLKELMAKVLLFGRNGQLGWELAHRLAFLGELTMLGSAEVDFARPEAIRSAVRAAQPSVIVNAAAYTAVDKAESEPELAWAINAQAPGVLAEEAARAGSLLVHYSTDYVFDGSKAEPYIETDPTNPLNVYGKSKLGGEQAIARAMAGTDGRFLIFRTSWVYGARGANFLLTMLRLAKERSELRIVDDQVGAPTSSEALAEATAAVLQRIFTVDPGGAQNASLLPTEIPLATLPADWSGIYHLTCAGATSWFGFAKEFLTRRAEATGAPMPTLIPIPTAEFPRPARRPANSRLSCEHLRQTFGVTVPPWQQALHRVLDQIP